MIAAPILHLGQANAMIIEKKCNQLTAIAGTQTEEEPNINLCHSSYWATPQAATGRLVVLKKKDIICCELSVIQVID